VGLNIGVGVAKGVAVAAGLGVGFARDPGTGVIAGEGVGVGCCAAASPIIVVRKASNKIRIGKSPPTTKMALIPM